MKGHRLRTPALVVRVPHDVIGVS